MKIRRAYEWWAGLAVGTWDLLRIVWLTLTRGC